MNISKIEKKSLIEENILESDIEKMIISDPTILNLGNIEIIKSQLKQKYGILDILALDSINNIYYEIELMLGELDSSHLTRVLDYWANEKSNKLYSEHIPVIICESVRGRYQKLVSILPDYLPLILTEISVFKIGNKNYINCEHIYYPNGKCNKKIKKKYNKSICTKHGLMFIEKILKTPSILNNTIRDINKEINISVGAVSKFINILKNMKYVSDEMEIINIDKLIEYKNHIKQVLK